MRWLGAIARAWGPEINTADRTRVILGVGYLFGALSHFGWLSVNGSPWYHGPAPEWAAWFWYGVCAVDFVVFWLILVHPRAGVAMGIATMITTLTVNWTQFPTFEYTFNWVLFGLTLFGVIVFALAPWLWRASRWKLHRPPLPWGVVLLRGALAGLALSPSLLLGAAKAAVSAAMARALRSSEVRMDTVMGSETAAVWPTNR